MLSPTGNSAPPPAQPASSGSVPPALARLPAGSLIAGTVAGRDGAGQLLVRTNEGTLPLATRLDLVRGATVTLRVAEGPLFTTIVESVDGRPVETAPRPPAVDVPPPAPVAPPPQDASSRTINTLLTAVVIATLPDAAAPARSTLLPADAAAPPAPAVGSRVTFQVVSIIGAVTRDAGAALAPSGSAAPSTAGAAATTPATAVSPPATQALPSSPGTPTTAGGPAGPASPGLPATPPGQGTTPPAVAAPAPVVTLTAPPGANTAASPTGFPASPSPANAAPAGSSTQPVAAGATAAANPGQASPAATPLPSSGTSPGTPSGGQTPVITAIVTSIDGSGRPVLSTALGILQLETRAPIPIGASLTLRLAEAGPPIAATPAVAGSAAPAEALVGLARDWPALREVVEVLRQIDPALADRVGQRTIATPGANLAQSALFFLSALRGGDLAGWLGRGVIRALEDSGRGDLVRRLAGEFGQIARLADQPPSGEWQPLLVPLYDGEQLRQLRLFIRRHRGEDDAEGGTRFVVDVELSRLGELQLDGLLHERRFDLILRSHGSLADGARADIAAIFTDGLATAGLVGTLSFQVARIFPVAPLDEILAGDHDGVIV